MQLNVTFRHMEPTDALKEYVRSRMDKIKKYFPDPISCNVVMSAERHNHKVDVSVHLHNGFRIAGHESTENMYSSIDMVSTKIERQVRRYKDKLREHKVRDRPSVSITHSVVHEPEEKPEAHETQSNRAEGSGSHQVVTKENFDATPMTVPEAIMQLNLLHNDFHVFLNEQSGQVNVVYRRDDGAYGLLEAPSN